MARVWFDLLSCVDKNGRAWLQNGSCENTAWESYKLDLLAQVQFQPLNWLADSLTCSLLWTVGIDFLLSCLPAGEEAGNKGIMHETGTQCSGVEGNPSRVIADVCVG